MSHGTADAPRDCKETRQLNLQRENMDLGRADHVKIHWIS